MVLLEFLRGQVSKTRVRPHRVEMPAPGFDDDLGLAAGSEPLDAKTFVAELAVEGLVGAVLPRFAGVDVGSLDLRVGKPIEDGIAHELRAIVRAQIHRSAMHAHQPRQHVDNPRRADAASHVDRKAFMGELVDHRQALELLPVGAGIEHKVVGPDMVAARGGSGRGRLAAILRRGRLRGRPRPAWRHSRRARLIPIGNSSRRKKMRMRR